MEELIVVAGCLILNGLFSCFEMAFVTVTKPQLRQMARVGVKSAEKILKFRENPERTLSIVQIGITLVGLISAAVGGAGAEESLSPFFEKYFGLSENASEALAIAAVVIPLTLINVVIGELVPKTLALRNPLGISLLGAKWISIADRFLSPIITLLEKLTKIILFIIPQRSRIPRAQNSEEIEQGEISTQTQQYVLNLVRIENQHASSAMIPWENVNHISINDDREAVLSSIVTSGHTRLPVIDDGKVVGILHTKEFIAALAAVPTDWKDLIRPHIVVSKNELVLKALRKMQELRSHLSIVTDAEGMPTGILTFQDVIEGVVGDLYDEDDDGKIQKLISSNVKLRSRSKK